MRSVTFPYKQLRAYFFPIIPVVLYGRNLTFRTEAYVDSGAFYSIFQSEILENLRLRREEGRLRILKTADGSPIPAYLFRLPIQIADVKIRAQIAFSDKLNIGFNLLGRQSVFSSFKEVAFNEREKKVIFRLQAKKIIRFTLSEPYTR